MLQKLTTIILLTFPLICHADLADTLHYDLDEIEIISTKEHGGIRQKPSAISVIKKEQLENSHITSLKETAPLIPSLYIPDYGSRLTSAIYIRGVGSRINTPAVGLYVDNVPYTDKSAFDFPFYDIERIDVLRGPQGTLYGRNTMAGLIRITTRNPFDYQGTDLKIGYNTGNNARNVTLTHYHRPTEKLAFTAGGYYKGSDGFFKNDYTGEDVDASIAAGARMRAIWRPSRQIQIDATTSFDHTNEGAYPYYYYGTLKGDEEYSDYIGKITNNHESRYKRNMVNTALNFSYYTDTWQLNAVTGYQHITDRMFLDQDFLSDDIYTLEQRQRINSINEEITMKSRRDGCWQWVNGINFMYQWLNTDAPVVFREDGLKWLANNINASMPDISKVDMLSMMGFTGMGVGFNGKTMPILSNCETPVMSAAIFHQSEINISDHITASIGLRLDYEKQEFHFDSNIFSNASFRMHNPRNPKMAVNIEGISLDKHIGGESADDYLQLLPKFALKYQIDKYNNIYASVSMGQRSGGYNIQMLGDFMESHLRADMSEKVKQGVVQYLHNMVGQSSMPSFVPDLVEGILNEKMPQFERASIEHLVYKPERSWNYEFGAHVSLFDHTLQADGAIYMMNVSEQQIARFTPSGLGRMMTNAGESRSYGAELSLHARPIEPLNIIASYGYTHATFTHYDAGEGEDYSGRRIPFVPRHTATAGAVYTMPLKHPVLQTITVGADATMAGSIYWNESNTMRQPFYATLNAHCAVSTQHVTLRLWAKNLTSSRYNTFCFESMQREYRQHAKPLHAGIEVIIRMK